MGYVFTPLIAQQLNVKVLKSFDAGAAAATSQMSPVLDFFRKTTSDTYENVYLTADSDYSIHQRPDNSAQIEFDGVLVYESRVRHPSFYKFIEVSLVDWSDDKVGKYDVVFHKLGMTMALSPGRLGEDTMVAAGTAQNASGNHDGVPLISTAHPKKPKRSGGGTFSNKLVRTAGLTFDTFGEAWSLFRTQPNEDGRPANRRPTKLLHRTVDIGIARDICLNDRPSQLAGGGNPYLRFVEPVEVPFFDSVSSFGFELIDDSYEYGMPYIFQEREPLRLVPLYTNPEDPWVKINNKLLWGLMGRYGAGYQDPRGSVRVTLS
jgi:phage major head subunit gpT-like protein